MDRTICGICKHRRYKLEITLYELTTIIQTEYIEGEKTTEYVVEKGGTITTLTEEEYTNEVSKGSSGFFSWLKDQLEELINGVADLLQKILDAIKELLGFNVKVTTDYVPIVTRGNAFKYIVSQNYKIITEETVEYKEKQKEYVNKSDITSIRYKAGTKKECTTDKETKKQTCVTVDVYETAKYHVETTAYIDYEITTWTNKLEYVSTDITEYDEDNRFLQIFMNMVEKNDYNYTIDDVAIAVEIIESYYDETYTTAGSSIDYSALPEGEFGWPVPANKVVSALFGYTAWYGDNHGGIDIWAADESGNPTASFSYVGKIDVVAAQKGTVIKAFEGGCADGNRVSQKCGGSYGNYIMIQHENNYITVYGHLARGSIAVKVGEEVEAGQYLGKMGSSGNSSGTHLHFEIRFDNTRIDPLAFYDVEPYNYNVPYASRNNSGITMANPYKVNFSI